MLYKLQVLMKLAARNLLRHTRKNILIALLIAVGIMGLFVANSILITTNKGLEELLINSLTGELMVGIQADEQYSIFGNEIPIVSEYDTIPPLSYYPELKALLVQDASIEVFTPIVSTAASMQIGNFTGTVPLFGIDPDSYFLVCKGISIKEETRERLSRGGVVLNDVLKDEIEAQLGRPLEIDEPIVFSMYSGNSFKLRKGYYAGSVNYKGRHDVINRIVLADPSIPRGLVNYTVGTTTGNAKMLSVHSTNTQGTDTMLNTGRGTASDKEEDSFPALNQPQSQMSSSVDDLFSEVLDVTAESSASLSIEEIEHMVAKTEEERSLTAVDTGAWSFVLVKTKSGDYPATASILEKRFRELSLPLKIQTWRTASGSSIQILFALQLAFYFGMIFLIFGALLVIMNSLVLTVLERTSEIGTMRSLGSSKSFIAKMLALESVILTLVGTLIGIGFGIVICIMLGKSGITLKNPLLISMFGGTTLIPYISAGNIGMHFAAGILAGACAWVYPLRLALKIPPVVAINRGNS